jgi:hypothetical protein
MKLFFIVLIQNHYIKLTGFFFTLFLYNLYDNNCSLYRTPNLEEAEVKFCVLKDKLPVFIEISKEVSLL